MLLLNYDIIKLLQKKKYSTPTTRFASIVKIFDYKQLILTNLPTRKKVLNKKKKFFFLNRNNQPHNNWGLNLAGVVYDYVYNKKPYQLLLNVKSLFNHTLLIPGFENSTPGNVVYNYIKNLTIKNSKYLGSQITVENIPYYVFLNSLTNNLNNKLTYTKSSGSFSLKIKAKKTVKLILIKLSSNKLYFFTKNVRCFVGKKMNFFNNKFIEGKWGFSLHNKKKLVVRGVAMNPVDHPNGGRTKAKQPEKSPWGWIAKSKK